MRIVQVAADELAADPAHVVERVVGRGDDLAPVRTMRMRGIDGDDAAVRGLQIGAEKEDWPVVVDEIVARVEVVEQFHDRGFRVGKILVIDAVL